MIPAPTVSTQSAGKLSTLTRVVEASTTPAGLGSLSRASAFAALVASRLSAGPSVPNHSMPRSGVDASTFAAGTEIASRELAGVASLKSAGPSQSMFSNYRQQLQVNSDHGSETLSVSIQISTGAHSLALKKLAGDAMTMKKVAGSRASGSKKQAGNVQVPGVQGPGENIKVPGFQDQAENVEVPALQISFLNDRLQPNLQPTSGCLERSGT